MPLLRSIENPRERAGRILARWLRHGGFPGRLLDQAGPADGFTTELVMGVVRWHRALAWIRRRLAPRRPAPEVDALLLTGLYQVFFMDTVAPHAVVHETVAAVKRVASPADAGFVNAVLRRALREKDELRSLLAAQSPGVRLSHPDELVGRWEARFGKEAAAALMAWNNTPPDIVLRVNEQRVEPAAYGRRLAESGVAVRPHPRDGERNFILPRGIRIPELPGYGEGAFFVQDPSTQLAVERLDPRPGERVLDACAAPGGKTMLIAGRMRGEGVLVAADVKDDRLERVRENGRRLGWPFVKAVRADAASPEDLRRALGEAARGGFDRVLVDAPCTNTGVIRRRPDVRWNFSRERLDAARAAQAALLDAVSECVAAGGRLVYSTCSLEPEENEEQVAAWLVRHPAFRLLSEESLAPPGSGTDGAYVATLTNHNQE